MESELQTICNKERDGSIKQSLPSQPDSIGMDRIASPPCFRSQVWAELVERAIRYAYLPGSKGCFSYVPVWLYCYYMVRLHLILSPAGFSAAMHWLIHSQVSSPSHPQNKLRNKYLHLPDHLPH